MIAHRAYTDGPFHGYCASFRYSSSGRLNGTPLICKLAPAHRLQPKAFKRVAHFCSRPLRLVLGEDETPRGIAVKRPMVIACSFLIGQFFASARQRVVSSKPREVSVRNGTRAGAWRTVILERREQTSIGGRGQHIHGWQEPKKRGREPRGHFERFR